MADADRDAQPLDPADATELVRALRQQLALAQERFDSLVTTAIEMALCLEYDPPVPASLPPDEQARRLFESAVIAVANDRMSVPHFGCPARDVIGRRLADATPPMNHATFLAQLRLFVEAGYHELNVEYGTTQVDGTPVSVEVNRHGTIVGGQVVRSWHMSRDVTQRKATERALDDSARQLEQAQKLESLGLLAGGIAHDFNNLLSAFAANLDLARLDVKRGRPPQGAFAAMDDAIARARELTRRVLVFSRPEAELRREPLSLPAIVDECARLVRATLPPGVRIESRVDPRTPRVAADSTQMHQVVMNLVQNAVQASEPAGGDVTIVVEPVDLPAGPHVRLSVRDTGAGMDARTRARIFDPFFTTKPRGTGLGLSVVHRIVAAHGGSIQVRSEPGQGAELEVVLPALEPPVVAPPPPSVAPPVEARPPRDVHVLFVDDEPRIAELTAHVLVHHGFRVTVQTSAALALEAFRAAPDSFDLVVTDHAMPGMSGLELAERITALRPGLPILLASGQTEPPALDAMKRAGVVGALPKPFPVSALAERIRAALAPR
jgi:signal transduction histidine kinase/ActR/RegA family two-component response regulator